MKLLLALALLALASAKPEAINLPTPTAVNVVDGPTPTIITADDNSEDLLKADDLSLLIDDDATDTKNPTTIEEITPVKVIDSPIDSVADEIVPVKVIDAPIDSVADEIVPVKVIDAPIDSVADEIVPVKAIDAPSGTIGVVDGPIDIAFNVPEILDLDDPVAMRKLYPLHLYADISPTFVSSDVMRQVEMDSNAINVGGAHPFSFNSGEPLDSEDTVMVVDSPVDELNYRMDPVVVVEAPTGEQAFFAEMPKVPESVKLVDNVDFQESVRPMPREMWRRAPMEEEQRIVHRPVYYRDVNMLRRDGQYQMPAAAYRDQILR